MAVADIGHREYCPMSRVVHPLLFCLLIPFLAASTSAADYLEGLKEAVAGIETGAYDQAAAAIEKAFAINDSDPLGHLALGTVYLHVGKLGQAEEEYRAVIKVKPGEWQAHYALALLAFLKGDQSAADKKLAAARKLARSSPEIVALDFYRAYLRGDEPPPMSNVASKSALGGQVAAMTAIKAGSGTEAEALLLGVLDNPAPLGFEENRAPVATFDRASPVAFPPGKLTWKPPERVDAPVLSGTVLLKADVSRAAGVEFVTFYVDDSFVGITNYEPFEFNWNTTNHPNGLHDVRMEGKDRFANLVSTKSVCVRLANANPRKNPPHSGPEVDELTRRLWNCIRLSEHRKLAHYHLAKLLLESGDTEAAVRQIEYVVAYQPDFRDARKLLADLRKRPMEYHDVWRGSSGSKKLALTFDDGPNERTGELLEVLAKLGVRATFFVVGCRAETQPELVRAIQAAGHQIENHSYTHPNLAAISPLQIEQELCKTSAVIRRITGEASLFFRPPGGHANGRVREVAGKHGLTGVFWTVNCSPYEGASHIALASHVISNASDGGIVLMHNGEPTSTLALPAIVDELREQGYEFVTLSELLEAN